MARRVVRIGRDNSTFQALRALKTNRNRRHRTGTFIVEGVEPITSAVLNGWACEALVTESGRRLSAWAGEIMARAPTAVSYEVAPDLFGSLSDKSDASEILAVFRMRANDLAAIPVRASLLAAVFDRPSNHGNLGTFIRSCEAFGAHGVIISGHGVDPYDQATITAGRGALFAMPILRVPSAEDVFAWSDHVRGTLGACALVGVETDGARDVWAHDFRGATIVVAGSERQGLSRAYRERCDAVVRIPMPGAATSVNVSVAMSIVLYEIIRQRGAAS
jgi:23S rRNA (uridine2479-2'-O)-methyltransferase